MVSIKAMISNNKNIIDYPEAKEIWERIMKLKMQVFRDCLMKRYSQSLKDLEQWYANFDHDLELYVKARIEEKIKEDKDWNARRKQIQEDSK